MTILKFSFRYRSSRGSVSLLVYCNSTRQNSKLHFILWILIFGYTRIRRYQINIFLWNRYKIM